VSGLFGSSGVASPNFGSRNYSNLFYDDPGVGSYSFGNV
jgi:hypothetical protein